MRSVFKDEDDEGLRRWLIDYRLAEGLSYEDLALRMTGAGFPMRLRTVYRMLQGFGVLEKNFYRAKNFRQWVERTEKRHAARRLKAAADDAHVG